MFRNHVHVGDWSDHLDVKLLFSVCESGFKNDKIVAVEVGFEVESFGEWGHFSPCEIDPALDFTGAVAEFEHVGVVLAVDFLESGDDGDGVEFLSVESGVVLEVVVDLVDGEGDDGLVVDRLVFLFGWVHEELKSFPLFDYIIKHPLSFKQTNWNPLVSLVNTQMAN